MSMHPCSTASSLQLMPNSQPAEYMQIDDSYSPSVHRINQAIRQRAVHPSDPIAPPAEVLMKWSLPPQELVSASASQLQKLVGAAEVKKGKAE
jgi:ATP-dependent DNA helicase 2 subunit 2